MQNLSVGETEDLVQNVMIKVFNARKYFIYDPAKGIFRDYLGRIIRNEIVNILRARGTDFTGDDVSEFPEDQFTRIWTEQWEEHLWSMALEELKKRVSETTFQALDLYALQNMPAEDTAAFLNLKIVQVYKPRPGAKNCCGKS